MCNERVNPGRKASAILLLAVTAALAWVTPAQAQLPTAEDLIGATWNIKDKKTNTKIATLELLKNGQFEMVVGKGNTTRYPANPKAIWEINGATFRVVYDPAGRGKQVYIRGKISNWTKKGNDAFFELTLDEVNRLPAKEGDVLILDK
jgi:hypothetical protein